MKTAHLLRLVILFIIALPIGFHLNYLAAQHYQRVLDHYKNDTLKLRAAQFLVDNMDVHYTYQATAIDSFYWYMDSVFSLPLSDAQYRKGYDDSFARWGAAMLESRKPIYDKDVLTDEFLIHQIDAAFEMWQTTWNSQYSFEIFCQYILPYRVGNEPLSDWRPRYVEHYASNFALLETVQTNYGHVYGLVNRLNRNYHANLYYPRSFLPSFSLEQLLKLKAAPCGEYSHLKVAKLRAFGIPAAIDYVPQWGTSSMGHEWNVLIQQDGTGIPFGPYETLGNHTLGHCFNVIPKVYRKTYDKQPNSLYDKTGGENVPSWLASPCMKDVTDQYTQTGDLSVSLFQPVPEDSTIVYLAVFNNIRWVPVTWSVAKGTEATFKNLGRGVVYLPVTWNQGRVEPVGLPVLLDHSGTARTLLPDPNTTQSVTVTRKYHPKDRTGNNLKLIEGGKFQVANQPDFSDAVTLYTIPLHDRCRYERVPVDCPGEYLYFRYLAPQGSHGIMAEVHPMDKAGKPIPFEEISGNRRTHDNHGPDKLFDHDVLTTFESHDADGVWAGLRFSKPRRVHQVRYLARNDDNDVREGEVYELLLWAGDGWRFLGRQTGTESGELVFPKVPQNGLYLLHNHTKGREERIFTYENDTQIWW